MTPPEGPTGVTDADRHLAADGQTDDGPALEALIERVSTAGGGTIVVPQTDDCYRFESPVRPDTDGNRVVIEGGGGPVLDVGRVSVPGETGKISFTDAANVTCRNLTIRGANRDGLQFGMRAGDGFRFAHLTFDTGQGGLEIGDGAHDVHGWGLLAHHQHDTDHGWASGLHVGRAQDVHVSGFDVRDSDRGVECDDGPRDVVIENGYVADIDNRGASNAAPYTFALDTHVHEGAPHVDGLRFRNVTLERCLRGFTAGAHDGVEQLRGVLFEHITQRDCPAPILEGDVTARHVRLCAEDPRPYACQIRGGSVTLEDWTVEYAPTAAQVDVIPSPNDRVEHGHHRITDVEVLPRTPSSAYRARDGKAPIDPEAGISSAEDSRTVGLRVAESAAVDDCLVERYRSEASLDESVRFENRAVVGGEHAFPARLRECVFPADAPLAVSGATGDVLVDGGRCSGEVEGEGTVEFEHCVLGE